MNPLFRIVNSSGQDISIICWSDTLATISADHDPTIAVAMNKDMAKQIAEYLLSWVNSDNLDK